MVQVFYDVGDSTDAPVTLTIHDATDGDTATVDLYNSSADTDDVDVGANETGEGNAMQVQLGKLDASGGDGQIDEIGSIEVEAGGNADVDMSAINLDKTSKYDLGTRNVEEDDELETETIHEADGEISVDSVDSLGTTFDDATIHGLSFGAHFEASELSGDDASVSSQSGDDAGYPNWDQKTTINYRLELPDAYDLSYSGAELKAEQKHTEPHYVSVQYAEGTDDTEFSEIDDSDWTDITDDFSSEDETVTIDDTVEPGTSMVLQYENLWTSSEYQTVTSGEDGDAGGGAGILGGSGDSIVDMIFGLPGAIVAAVAGLVGRAKGWI